MDEVHVLGIALGIITAVVVVIVIIALLLRYYRHHNRKLRVSPKFRYQRVSSDSLESCDELEPPTQPTSLRFDADSSEYVCHDPPVSNINQERRTSPLPNNFQDFITGIIIPFFKEQRSTANQFAVVVLLSEKDFYNICSMTFVPSNGGQPLVDKYYASMPQNATQYGNYIVARPISSSCHSEEEIFGNRNSPFSQLWNAYMRRNGSPPKCVLLYSWNLPCSRCTDVIIRSLNDSMYSCTSVIVAHTTYWQGEVGGQCTRNEEKLTKENITVEQVRYPEYIPPA